MCYNYKQLGDCMKKILKTIKKWLIALISFLYHLFFQSFTKKKRIVLEEKSILKKTENTTKSNTVENWTDQEISRNLFKEHLEIPKKESFTKSQIEKEFYTEFEKLFKVKIIDFSETQKEKLKIYSEKIVKKIEEEIHQNRIHHKEDLKKSLKEKIDIDIKKKGKDLNKILDIPPVGSKEILASLKASLEVDTKTSTNEIETLKYVSPLREEKEKMESPIILQENVVIENKFSKVVKNGTNNYSEIQTSNVNLPPQSNFNLKILDAIKVEAKKSEEVLIKDQEEQKKVTNSEEQENKMSSKANEEIKKDVKIEKNENIPALAINFYQLENQYDQILKNAKSEYEKEELIDKQYDEIEEIITEKIIELKSLLNKTLTEEQKKKVINELEKLIKIQEQVSLHREQDLEELRISLEEVVSFNEKKLITEKMQAILNKDELEIQNKLLNLYESKPKKEFKKMKKQVIKEQFQKILYRLEFPLFLGFPFIKNKYFRKFIKSLFIFKSFHFIKRILFNSPSIKDPIDLSAIKKGSDALHESLAITEKNIYVFGELKRETFAQYPELLEDEEFLSTINHLEQKLTDNYEKLLKHEKVVDKYFHKSKILTRKRKLY